MNLGVSLKMALVKRGKKNKDLAAFLGVHPAQITNWIANGNMNQENLLKVCEYLNMKVSDFIALSED